MLNLYPAYVAWHYYLFITLATLGAIQAAASVAGLRGLQIGGRLWRRGFAYGALLLSFLGGGAWFVLSSPDYISPGLAGTELIAMFAAGVTTSLAISLVGGLLCPPPGCWCGSPRTSRRPLVSGCAYELLAPVGVRRGLVVLLPDPDLSREASLPAARAATEAGWACALLDWLDGALPYPDALAYAPLAISECAQAVNGSSEPVALIGLGLAGDLALRAGCDDDRVALAGAIGSLLRPDAMHEGLLLLREMSLPLAWRWGRRWNRAAFLRPLRLEEALARLGGRAVICASSGDGFYHHTAESLGRAASLGASTWLAGGCTHRQLVESLGPDVVSRWLEGLGGRDAASAG